MTSDPTLAPAFRVLVTGSRTWTDSAAITRALDELHARHGEALRIVHGACPRGADAIADTWATQHGVPVEAHPADWSTGRRAGPDRNAAMVATRPGQCLAFITDASPGATGTADLAEHSGIPTTRHHPDDDARDRGDGRESRLVEQDEDQLVAVLDGPLAGQWFTWTDWQTRLHAAQHIVDQTGRRSPALDYIPAGYQIANPVLEHTRGWAAVYRPHPADAVAGSDRADKQTGPTRVMDEPADAHHDRQPVIAAAGDDDVLDLAG